MLSIFDRHQPLSRAMLTVGGLGIGGLALPHLLAAKARASTTGKPITTGKSVIFLLQHGGPTQFETFDPKLDVPEGIRTIGGVTKTSVPGMVFGSSLEKTAALAEHLAVVRSYTTGSSAHSLRPIVSEASRDANIGSIYSRLAGANHPASGMPTNVTLFPNSVEPEGLGPDLRFGNFDATGELGRSFAPFAPGGESTLQENMKLVLPQGRFDNRRGLLASLDKLRGEMDRDGSMEGVEKYRGQALDMVVRGVADAFDLTQEDPRTIARYDTQPFVDERRYRDKSNGAKDRRWYQNNAQTLGRLLLLARRLCEAGCGFVTVSTRFVWDMHADGNNLEITRGKEAVINPFDHAISAFIEDCQQRGVADDILLVATGEMGRTPKINARGGRDHWGRLAPLLLAGGGITHGQTIGQSTRDGGEPDIDPVNTDHLIATMMHALFNVGELRVAQGLPSDLVRFASSGTPIPGLF